MSERDLKFLNNAGGLVDLVGELSSEKGRDSGLQFKVGGKALLATRTNLAAARADLFTWKRAPHPAVIKTLEMLDACIKELDEPSQPIDIQLAGWTN